MKKFILVTFAIILSFSPTAAVGQDDLPGVDAAAFADLIAIIAAVATQGAGRLYCESINNSHENILQYRLEWAFGVGTPLYELRNHELQGMRHLCIAKRFDLVSQMSSDLQLITRCAELESEFTDLLNQDLSAALDWYYDHESQIAAVCSP